MERNGNGNSGNGKRAAIYARYSSAMQAEGFSIEAQLRACRELCTARGYRVHFEFVDEAQSAATTNRPEFQRMMSHAKAGHYDVLVCHKLDRLSRNLADIVTTLDDLRGHGVAFVSVAEAFDFDTPAGQIMLAVLGGLAQWYRANLQAETSKGKQAKARAGSHNGLAPFGYKRVPDTTRAAKPGKAQPTRLVPSEDADHARAAFAAYAAGTLTDSEIAHLLNERGALTSGNYGRRPFTKDTVNALLQNKTYAGFVMYRGMSDKTGPDRRRKRRGKAATIWHIGQHEALITEALFERCQLVRAKRGTRYTGTYARQGSPRCYLLQRIAVCAKCGQPLRATAWTHGAEAYRCTSHERGLSCASQRRAVPQAALLDQLGDVMRGLRLTDELRAEAMRLIGGDELIEHYRHEKRKLEGELKRAGKVYQMGVTTEAQFEAEVRRIRAALDDLKPPASTVDLERAMDTLGDMAAIWAGATCEEQAEMLRTVFERVMVDTDARRIVGGTPRAAYGALVASAPYASSEDGRDGLTLIFCFLPKPLEKGSIVILTSNDR